MARTAAALVIGNEILTGKVVERNVGPLACLLGAIGVRLRRVVVCPDEVEEIAGELRQLSAAHDLVFTSGGVGPTHDDVTYAAVALAFGRRIVRSEPLANLLRAHFGPATHEGHLRLADVPEGAELLVTPEMPWPTVQVHNVYVMPGVPELFRAKLHALRDRLAQGRPFASAVLYTTRDEFDIADALADVARRHAEVAIGSYPSFRRSDWRVKVTVDGGDPDAVERARAALVEALGPESIVVPRD
ncbi:MAG: competence/damage-inducible protein A [Myxococcota bacterium]|nr:competence/damage-inducible protein A [Myxococcota bacterium]MDW8362861.1 competence/damage-inducible protein A [Myxococcales bacterium]